MHEKETMANANAIKKIPTIPPLSACASTFVPHELGKVSSNAPKKDTAKITNNKKKITLNQTLVANAFNALAPKIAVITVPSKT